MLYKHEVDIALIATLSGFTFEHRQVSAIELSQINFVTVATKQHPLYKKHGNKTYIDTLLKHPFVVPSTPIYGTMAAHRSLDGCHDEKFNRKIKARADTVASLISLVKYHGLIAYIPDYVAKEHGLEVIDITGCPYNCKQYGYVSTVMFSTIGSMI